MKVAVIGTGTLGPSIAQVFSQCEKVEKVYLCKGRVSSKNTGKDKIERSLSKLVQKEKITPEQADEYLSKIETGSVDLAGDADLLVEAVSEDVEIKKTLFMQLDEICDEKTVFATNTSSL